MELTVTETRKTAVNTLGRMNVDGVFECYTLEPVDRGLTSAMTEAEILAIKQPGITRIPAGRYQVDKIYWPAPHNRFVPTLRNVPGFTGVGIHSVATHKDTKGCIGVGRAIDGDDLMGNGFGARDALYTKIWAAMDGGQAVWITIC